jgi:hypothetical protein
VRDSRPHRRLPPGNARHELTGARRRRIEAEGRNKLI